MTTQQDVLNARIAVLQNQKTGVDLQAAAQKSTLDLQITQAQAQIDRLNTPSPTPAPTPAPTE